MGVAICEMAIYLLNTTVCMFAVLINIVLIVRCASRVVVEKVQCIVIKKDSHVHSNDCHYESVSYK